MSAKQITGIIGGSGLYEMPGLAGKRWKKFDSVFGEPSDELLFGEIEGNQLVFLPRHGRGHRIPPTEINYRANIDVLKQAGVTDIISVSAVGSLREDLAPGTFVVVDQFVDKTFARKKTFFGTGLVAHIAGAHPVCARIGRHLLSAATAASLPAVAGGTYVVMEGPQFSSLAESNSYRASGWDVIGMTNMPEAKLAREAEICYATLAMVTDYDCWHPDHDSVTVEAIVKVLLANASNAAIVIKAAAARIGGDASAVKCSCRWALENAVMTAPDMRSPEMVSRLDNVAGRVLRSGRPNP